MADFTFSGTDFAVPFPLAEILKQPSDQTSGSPPSNFLLPLIIRADPSILFCAARDATRRCDRLTFQHPPPFLHDYDSPASHCVSAFFGFRVPRFLPSFVTYFNIEQGVLALQVVHFHRLFSFPSHFPITIGDPMNFFFESTVFPFFVRQYRLPHTLHTPPSSRRFGGYGRCPARFCQYRAFLHWPSSILPSALSWNQPISFPLPPIVIFVVVRRFLLKDLLDSTPVFLPPSLSPSHRLVFPTHFLFPPQHRKRRSHSLPSKRLCSLGRYLHRCCDLEKIFGISSSAPPPILPRRTSRSSVSAPGYNQVSVPAIFFDF